MNIKDNLDLHAWTSEPYLGAEIRAVRLAFHGLGATAMKERAETMDLELASRGILTVQPYCGTWVPDDRSSNSGNRG